MENGVFYRGQSLIDGAPIVWVAIYSGRNSKTGRVGRGENRHARAQTVLALMAHRCAARGSRAAIPCAMTAGDKQERVRHGQVSTDPRL